MDVAAVFVLALLGGYCFASLWRFTAYATRRVDGHHLYFRAALYGVVLFGAALLIRITLLTGSTAYAQLEGALVHYIKPLMKAPDASGAERQVELARQAQMVVTAAYALGIGPLLALLLNFVTRKRWVLRYTLSVLDKLLLRSQEQRMPVLLTLSTGKIYIGPIVSISDPDRPPAMVVVLPMFSGHRDTAGRMSLTSDYETVYQELRKGKAAALNLTAAWITQFQLAIRADTIVSATLFSPAIYSEFNPQWQEKIRQAEAVAKPQELLVEIRRREKREPPTSGGVTSHPTQTL